MLVVVVAALLINVQEVIGQKNSNNETTTNPPKRTTKIVPLYSKQALAEQEVVLKMYKNDTCNLYCKPKPLNSTIKLRKNLLTMECENKTFVLSKTPKRGSKPTGLSLHSTCCELGLIASRVETREGLMCLYESYKNITGDSRNRTDTYYVNYGDLYRNRRFLSCPDKSLINDDLFAPDEPDNKNGSEPNIHVKITPPLESIGFYDASAKKPAEVLCQHPISYQAAVSTSATSINNTSSKNISRDDSTTKIPKRTTKIVPLYSKQALAEQELVLKMYKNDTCNIYCKPKPLNSTIKLRKQLVTMECENKTFVVSKTPRGSNKPTGLSLFSTCCELGLILARVETREGLMCLYESYKNITGDARNRSELFYVNYGDLWRNRRFVTCPDKSPINDDLFAPEEPDNKNGGEPNIQIKITPPLESIGFYDTSGKISTEVLCQHPPPIVAAVNITNTTTGNNNTSSKNSTQISSFNVTTVTVQLPTTTPQYRTALTSYPAVMYTTPPRYYVQQPTINYNYMGPPTFQPTIPLIAMRPPQQFG